MYLSPISYLSKTTASYSTKPNNSTNFRGLSIESKKLADIFESTRKAKINGDSYISYQLNEIKYKLNNIEDEVIANEIKSLLNKATSNEEICESFLDLADSYLDMYHSLVGNYEYIGTKINYLANQEYDTYKRDFRTTLDNFTKKALDKQSLHENIKEPFIIDYANESKIHCLRNFIKLHPNDKISQYLYDKYYLELPTNKNLADYCRKIDSKYGVKIFLTADLKDSTEALEFLDKEFAEWKRCGGENVKFPPVLDFSQIKKYYHENKAIGGYTETLYNSISINTFANVISTIRHEMTHVNDLNRYGYKIPDKYNIEKIMPQKSISDKNDNSINASAFCTTNKEPDFENCLFREEFLKAGLPDFLIEYAYTKPAEFIAVASQGDMSKYSPEFKQMLNDFGMPKWELNMKCLDPKILQELELVEYLDKFARENSIYDEINYKDYTNLYNLYKSFEKLSKEITNDSYNKTEIVYNTKLLFEMYWNKCNTEQMLKGNYSSIGTRREIIDITKENARIPEWIANIFNKVNKSNSGTITQEEIDNLDREKEKIGTAYIFEAGMDLRSFFKKNMPIYSDYI